MLATQYDPIFKLKLLEFYKGNGFISNNSVPLLIILGVISRFS